MALETRDSGQVVYLQVDFGRKSLYIYSPVEKEGYEEHTSSKGTVTYRQYIKSVSGYITNAYFRDGNFGQEFILRIDDKDEKYSIAMQITDSVFTQLARSINNVDVSKRVSFSVYGKKAKNGKTYINVGLNYPDELDDTGKYMLVEWGEELPQPKQLRSGKWDFVDMEEEAYIRAEKFIKDNDFNSGQEVPTEREEAPTTPNPNAAPVMDDEDLPF